MASEPGQFSAAELEHFEHVEAVKKLNAIYTNQVFVQPLGDGNIRINFGETLDEEPRYHTSVVVSAANALDFANLVARMANSILSPPPVFTPTPRNNG